LIPPVAAGALFLAALVARCFLGALAPVDFLAVYFVLAIFSLITFFFPTLYYLKYFKSGCVLIYRAKE